MKVLFFIVVGLKIVASDTDEFSRRAEALLDNFDTTFNTTCSEDARRMAETFQSMDKPHKYAVSIVNLNYCDVGRSTFDVSIMFAGFEFGLLLDDAITLLSQQYGVSGQTVYSSDCDCFPNVGVYIPGKFLNTSTSFYKAFSADSFKGCFVTIRNVQGLKVGEFSKNANEEQVLIASTASYYVEEKKEVPIEKLENIISDNYQQVFLIIVTQHEPGFMTLIYELFSVFGLW